MLCGLKQIGVRHGGGDGSRGSDKGSGGDGNER